MSGATALRLIEPCASATKGTEFTITLDVVLAAEILRFKRLLNSSKLLSESEWQEYQELCGLVGSWVTSQLSSSELERTIF